jgi:trigger factor
MSRVLENSVEAAVADLEEKPLAYAPPALEGEPEFSVDKDFTFSVTYDIYPSFETPSLEGVAIEVPVVTVGEEDIARELEQIRERNAIVVEKTGSIEKGDIATLSWSELDSEGNPIPSTAREDFTFEVGKGLNLYKFDDDILGLSAGETKTFSKSYPEDFDYKELAGKTITLSIKITKVKRKDLPALDDDLAQDISEKFKTIDDLRNSVSTQLAKTLEARIRDIKEKNLLDLLHSKTAIEIPGSMTAAELSMRWDSLKQEMGIDSDERMEKIAEYSGKSRKQLYEDWKPAVEKAIAQKLLLDALIEKSGASVSDEELEAEYARQAEGTALSPAEVKAEYEKRQSVEYLKERIKEKKYFDTAFASVTLLSGKESTYVDIIGINE